MEYIHASHKKIKNLYNVEQSKEVGFKPSGLWYANKYEWKVWAKDNMDVKYKYFYKIKVRHTTLDKYDKNKVLLIKTKKDFTNFTIKYGKEIKLNTETNMVLINWKKVAEDFGGIEIRNNQNKLKSSDDMIDKLKLNTKKKHLLWSVTIDVDSGCVWNIQCLKSFELL